LVLPCSRAPAPRLGVHPRITKRSRESKLAAFGMIIRVRSQVGTWRMEVASPATPIREIHDMIATQYAVPQHQQTLSLDQGGSQKLDPASTLQQNGLTANGSMLFLILDKDAKPPASGAEKKTVATKIGADGSIVAQTYDDHVAKRGFRPGMAALGDMKKAWTLSEFQLMDAQYEFKLKRQGETTCASVSLDADSCQVFQNYLQQLGWRQARVGVLYGTFEDDNTVRVECIREPPQNCTSHRFELLEDAYEETVEQLAAMLRLRKVGWIFAHPPREDGFFFSAQEVVHAAYGQLEAGDGPNATPFVTVRVTVNAEDGTSAFDAYQVSTQCLEMVAEGALEEDADSPGSCKVHPTFTAIVEGKAATLVDNNFFLCNVPVKTHSSAVLSCRFPKANRDGLPQTRDALRERLASADRRTGYVDALADFELLLFLCAFPEIFDPHTFMPAICDAVASRPAAGAAAAAAPEPTPAPPAPPLDEGYVLMLQSFAGLGLDD